MSIRVRRPDTDRLEISEGDYLIVKRDLTAGEFREMIRRSTRPMVVTAAGAAPAMELDPTAAGVAVVIAYLIDWSFADVDGRKLAIADQPANVVRAALDSIDASAYLEVQRAIQEHQRARAAALDEEKKTRNGEPAPDRTLMSVE